VEKQVALRMPRRRNSQALKVKPDQTESETQHKAWVEHNLSQLAYFQSLSLREKMHAVQGMADVVRRFDEMRESGKFRVLSQGAQPHPVLPARTASERAAPYTPNQRKDESA
jgi:hypothetical protein